jgi:hypothetical protein
MALTIKLLFISCALAAPWYRSTPPNSRLGPHDKSQRPISQDIFEQIALTEQYAAAAYCQSNTATPNVKIVCFSGNCPQVESSAAQIVIPVKASVKSPIVVAWF